MYFILLIGLYYGLLSNDSYNSLITLVAGDFFSLKVTGLCEFLNEIIKSNDLCCQTETVNLEMLI